MYSPAVLDHLENPRNAGELPEPSAVGEANNPVCGDRLLLHLLIEGGRIVEARFQAQACPPCLAAGSLLTEIVKDLKVEAAFKLDKSEIEARLAPLPKNKLHCAVLAVDCLRAALRDWEVRNSAV